jgi:hypothetical protein
LEQPLYLPTFQSPVAAASVIPGEITVEDLEWATKVVSDADVDSPAT